MMDNVLSKGLLLSVAVGLSGYGLQLLESDFWKALVALGLGVAVFVGREVLKKYGYDVVAMFRDDK